MTDRKGTTDPLSPAPAAVESVVAIQERLHVDIAERDTATVRVRTVVHKELVEIPLVLQRRIATIERISVNQFVDQEFDPFTDGSTLVVPVFEYVPVTEMRLMLKEEVRIGFDEIEETSVHTAEVQRQEVVIERRTGTDGDWIAQPASPSSEDGEQSVL